MTQLLSGQFKSSFKSLVKSKNVILYVHIKLNSDINYRLYNYKITTNNKRQ